MPVVEMPLRPPSMVPTLFSYTYGIFWFWFEGGMEALHSGLVSLGIGIATDQYQDGQESQ